MKTQIRKCCFETNSSSMHAIAITSKRPKIDCAEYESIEFDVNEFGWSHITYYDTYHKASYLWTSIVNAFIIRVNDKGEKYHYELDVNNPEYIKRKEAIRTALIHAGFEDDEWNIRFQEIFEKEDWGGISTGYIDHDPGLGFVDEIIFNEDRLLRYLFNDSSIITTWNDNEWYLDKDVEEKLEKEYSIGEYEHKDGYWEAEEWAHFNIPEDTEWKYLKGN